MRAAWLEIDCDAYRANLKALSTHSGRPVLAVVKANGYGHGMQLMAREALASGCCPGVAVALAEEGAELRSGGLPGCILVLGLTLEDEAGLLVAHNLDAVVTRSEMLHALNAAAWDQRKTAAVHVKVDTGMSRVGVEPEEALAFCREVRDLPHLRLAGVMTHFACADEPERPETNRQWSRFEPLMRELAAWEPRPSFHAANSPGALWFPDTGLDWVRAGIVTYGVNPGRAGLPFEARPVAALKGRVTQVKEIPAGRSVSYGGTWTAPRTTRLALVPLGYADGYPWTLSNRAEALIRGRRVPVRGRVCMDQLLLDVTALDPVAAGEEAVFLGRQGQESITAEELAAQAGTLSYEILTRWSARLPRLALGASRIE
jgi:alanine racemase